MVASLKKNETLIAADFVTVDGLRLAHVEYTQTLADGVRTRLDDFMSASKKLLPPDGSYLTIFTAWPSARGPAIPSAIIASMRFSTPRPGK